MQNALGPDLAPQRPWSMVDTPPVGELAAIFARTRGVNKWLHYLPVYESVIDRSRPIRMLEIGVFHGGSLRMWREYLHPQAVIVGIDIDPNCQQFQEPEDNIHVRIGAQQDATFLQKVNAEFGPFDVILDDGSHMTSHMVESFRSLFPSALADPGAYVVEDVHSNYWKPYRDSPMSFVDFIAVLIDAMHAHYPTAEGELNFRTDHPARLHGVSVPRITPMLSSIEIHDSIVVVRKASRDLPRSVYH
ncbi:class I SAM-dependent methyltransferase [Mycolicibacterium sp. P9-64]|nr:class I SAM-dependent methyltransferase [Mycolicibacterium sp. P9-64]